MQIPKKYLDQKFQARLHNIARLLLKMRGVRDQGMARMARYVVYEAKKRIEKKPEPEESVANWLAYFAAVMLNIVREERRLNEDPWSKRGLARVDNLPSGDNDADSAVGIVESVPDSAPSPEQQALHAELNEIVFDEARKMDCGPHFVEAVQLWIEGESRNAAIEEVMKRHPDSPGRAEYYRRFTELRLRVLRRYGKR